MKRKNIKIKHNPLGTVISKKKIIAGIAALTLIGGIAPAFINDSYAKENIPDYDPDETIFTAVGPDYVTRVRDELSYYRENDYTISISDTDVADFYENSEMMPCSYLECLQGKKIGDTEIILRKTGEETVRIPVRSVELTPEAYNVEVIGKQVNVTGSLNGADDSLLTIENLRTQGSATITRTGERSVSIRSFEGDSIGPEIPFMNGMAGILWRIGNQQISPTYYYFMNVEGIDNVYHLPENEEILEKAAMNMVLTSLIERQDIRPGSTITTIDGSIFHVDNTGGSIDAEPTKLQGVLDLNDTSATESKKSKLEAKLPDGAKGVTFKDITVLVNLLTKSESELDPSAPPLNSSQSLTSSSDSEDVYVVGHYETLSKPITMVIDVSDAPEVAKGYTRKWYVTRDNDGTIEKLEANYDKDTKTIRFETKVFGLHAYGYVDEKSAPAVPNTGAAPEKVAMVATATFAPLAAIAFGAFIARNRKKAANKLAKKHNHFE